MLESKKRLVFDELFLLQMKFLLRKRKINKKFISLNNLKVPEISADRCTGIDEEVFRDDISSTDIRLTNN